MIAITPQRRAGKAQDDVVVVVRCPVPVVIRRIRRIADLPPTRMDAMRPLSIGTTVESHQSQVGGIPFHGLLDGPVGNGSDEGQIVLNDVNVTRSDGPRQGHLQTPAQMQIPFRHENGHVRVVAIDRVQIAHVILPAPSFRLIVRLVALCQSIHRNNEGCRVTQSPQMSTYRRDGFIEKAQVGMSGDETAGDDDGRVGIAVLYCCWWWV